MDGGINTYAYVGNNPLNYTDSPGLIIDTIADIGFIAYDLYKLASDSACERKDNLTALGLDFVGAITPGVTGLGAASRVVKSKSLWSSTKSKSAVENALGHWNKHKSEFPELQNAKQYAEQAKDFLANPPQGILTKTNSKGDILRYDPATNTFGVLSQDGVPRTMFRPEDGMDYWNRQ